MTRRRFSFGTRQRPPTALTLPDRRCQHLLTSNVPADQAVDYLRWRSAAYMLYIRSSTTNFSSLTAGGSAIFADFNADANYDSDTDDSD